MHVRGFRAIDGVGAKQHGVVTRSQAHRAGFTDAMIRTNVVTGIWRRLHPGVYALAGAPPTWKQSVLAACLAAGEGAVACGLTAAALFQVEGISRGTPEVLVPTDRRPRVAGAVIRRTRCWTKSDRTRIDGIPVTTPRRLILDLGGLVGADTLGVALDDALRRKLVSVRSLTTYLAGATRNAPGRGVLRELVTVRSAVGIPQSALETRFLDLVVRAGLPMPVAQYPIVHGGRPIARVDYAWPSALLAVQLDGWAYHGANQPRWQRDINQDNSAAIADWVVLRFTWSDLDARGTESIDQVRRLLDQRG